MIRPPQRSPLFPSTTLSRSLPGSRDPAAPPPSSPPPATTPAKPAQTKAADLIDLHFDLDDAPPKAARTPPPLPGPAPAGAPETLDPLMPPTAAAAVTQTGPSIALDDPFALPAPPA